MIIYNIITNTLTIIIIAIIIIGAVVIFQVTQNQYKEDELTW